MMSKDIATFQRVVWGYYDREGRHELAWRLPEADGTFDAYKILVSEVMLQQTQVSRVVTKYAQFLKLFPTVQALAKAELGEVLVAWQGLGYNRRAKFLWQAAHMVVSEYEGVFPHDQQELTRLPGIGVNTAGAVVAYAYNLPVVYIETNIRTVYIHHFFADRQDVHDKEIAALVEASLPSGDDANIRLWYWALMDYGTHIKQTAGNKARSSKSYAKQSPFVGSKRAVRGAVIRFLSTKNQQGSDRRSASREVLATEVTDPRIDEVLNDLVREGMVMEEGGSYRLA